MYKTAKNSSENICPPLLNVCALLHPYIGCSLMANLYSTYVQERSLQIKNRVIIFAVLNIEGVINITSY